MVCCVVNHFIHYCFHMGRKRGLDKTLHPGFFPGRRKIRHLLFFFLFGNAVVLIACFLAVWLVGDLLLGYEWSRNINPLKLNIIYGSLANLLFHLVHTIIYFFEEYKKQWEKTKELQRITAQAEIQTIKNQINPHFLFNNLNVLSSMVLKENPVANKFIEEFASVYRFVLNTQDKEVVPLHTELEFLHSYLFLLQKRFVDGLEIDIRIPHHYMDRQIIPAALQMLVENAIKHNVVSRSKPLKIKIVANGAGVISVENNLQPRKNVEHSTNIGLKNISKRYNIISGQDIIINKSSGAFEVILPLLQLN